MAEVKTTVWLTNPEDAGTQDAYFTAYDGNMKTQGWFPVVEKAVPFDPPTREQVFPELVTQLREAQRLARAEAERRCNEIENRISKLLAIQYDGEVL